MMLRRLLSDEKGATLAVTAVMIAGVMAVLALAIDLGMLRMAHAEAQRAADSAALAGAAEYWNFTPAAAVGPAHDSALSYARKNTILSVPIDSTEVTIQVIPADLLLRVRIERTDIPLWFAKLFGRSIGTVSAVAAAAIRPAAAADCVAPFAVPDMWNETVQDTNRNRVWDANEIWSFDPASGDAYERFNNGATVTETGYGSPWRDYRPTSVPVIGTPGIYRDHGRQMVLKVQDPSSAPVSGFFYPFQVGTNTGAADYRASIAGCDPQTVPLNTSVPLEMGNMVGPTRQGVNDLIAQDPYAAWDPLAGIDADNDGHVDGAVVGSAFARSPRIKRVPLYDPTYITQVAGGNHTLTFNNFAELFVEGIVQRGNDEFVIGRFLYFVQGTGSGGSGNPGTLIRILQLVE